MRQVVPHRNNIGSVGRSCKTFLRPVRRLSVEWPDANKQFGTNVVSQSNIISIRTMCYANWPAGFGC
jgi:hypothetical protein